jgi:hypothetical protein
MYEIQTSHVRNMYAQVVEWEEACEYTKASKLRVFLLKHPPEARFECTAASLVEVSSVRGVGAVGRLPPALVMRRRGTGYTADAFMDKGNIAKFLTTDQRY